MPEATTAAIETPWNAQQLAAFLGMHKVTVLKWTREGRIPHRKLSARKILYIPQQIREWLVVSGSNPYTEPVGRAASSEREAA